MADLPELVEGVLTHIKIYGREVETRETVKFMQELPAPVSYVGYPLTMGDMDYVFGWVDLAKRGGSGFLQVLAFGPRDASYCVEPLPSSSDLDEATVREGAAGVWRLSRGLLLYRSFDERLIAAAHRAGTRRRLIREGVSRERADAWLDAWEAHEPREAARQDRAYWTAGWDWIAAQRQLRRDP
jgi:hypothetical protein